MPTRLNRLLALAADAEPLNTAPADAQQSPQWTLLDGALRAVPAGRAIALDRCGQNHRAPVRARPYMINLIGSAE